MLRNSTSRPNICFITNFITFWDGGNGAWHNALLNSTFSEFLNIVFGLTSLIHHYDCGGGAPFGESGLILAGRDSETFRDNGTEVPSLSRDKGTTGQAKNLAKGREGSGQPKSSTGRDSQKPGRDAGQNGTEQKSTF